MNWQPIETAPRDGTFVVGLLRFGKLNDRVKVVTFWSAERSAEELGGNADQYEPGWYDEDDDQWNPTWWMPLPEPPAAEKGSQ